MIDEGTYDVAVSLVDQNCPPPEPVFFPDRGESLCPLGTLDYGDVPYDHCPDVVALDDRVWELQHSARGGEDYYVIDIGADSELEGWDAHGESELVGYSLIETPAGADQVDWDAYLDLHDGRLVGELLLDFPDVTHPGDGCSAHYDLELTRR